MAWLLENDSSELPYFHNHLGLSISILLLEIYRMACKQTWLQNLNQENYCFQMQTAGQLLKLFCFCFPK